MSMQALNQLVARSIIDPSLLKNYSAGRIDDVMAELQFKPELRKHLAGLEAGSFAEFTMLAYRVVKATEEPARRIELPSPMDGLLDDQERSDREQVA
ncbi:MAG: hypothetical protein E4G99_12355 [Anaerolineales bacterium]|nr:MAG: hypothetical protein E4G99_12355 [Anaerolineales bacterium]